MALARPHCRDSFYRQSRRQFGRDVARAFARTVSELGVGHDHSRARRGDSCRRA